MFEEKLILRADVHNTKNRAAPSVHQIAICSFGKAQTLSLVAISQTLNKLVIRDLSDDIELIHVDGRFAFKRVKKESNHSIDGSGDERVTYVSTREIINSVCALKLEVDATAPEDRLVRDLLFIGCSNSISIYDTYEQTNLFSIHTACRISFFLKLETRKNQDDGGLHPLVVCGGVQRLHSIQVEHLKPLLPTNNLDKLVNIEISSERSTSDTITCLCAGRCAGSDLVVTGSSERMIKVYSLDMLDRNIRVCRLTLQESDKVTCIDAITTIQQQEGPSKQTALNHMDTQMNYFAYGLENGIIGVYRLISSCSQEDDRLFAERLWRHKSRHVPVSVVSYDVDGDGLSELVFGYSNGHLEARSPFTGQLVSKTRCFRSDELISLAVVQFADLEGRVLNSTSDLDMQSLQGNRDHAAADHSHKSMLIACSVSMSIVAFWLDDSKPHRPLIDFLAQQFDLYTAVKRASVQSSDEIDDSDLPMDYQPPDETKPEEPQVLGDLMGLELDIQSNQPVHCESKQNSDLICRLSALQNEQTHLRHSVSKFYFDKVQQISLFELDSFATGINLTHRWDFDESNDKLRLSVLVSNLNGAIELFEVESRDESWQLDSNERLSSLSLDNKTNLVILPIQPIHQSRETKLQLRVYCRQLGSRDMISGQLMESLWRSQSAAKPTPQSSVISRVYEETIIMPRFTMFVPDRQTSQDDTANMLKMSFRLEESTNYLQILDWMRDNFLCFKFGQLQSSDGDPVWPVDEAHDLIGGQAEPTVPAGGGDQVKVASSKSSPSLTAALRWSQHVPFDRPENWSNGRVRSNGETELELKLRSLKTSSERTDMISGSKLRIACSLARVLTIECQDVDLMADIVESLVIDCLKVSFNERSIIPGIDEAPRLDAVNKEIAAVGQKTLELEESEQRIQTELYEADDMIKYLIQQFAIANQLNEFETSKELLNEISMMLDGAQNSAQAYHLNNQERLEMSKKANHLREKMSFLLKC